jgi:RNA polymerase sigma-70 factor (ECF subfamily)
MTLQAASISARGNDKHTRFMALLEPCLAKLSRYCHAMTKDVESGRDLLSDAILLAYENFEKLRAPEAFTSYIFTTARRLFYRRERRKKFWGVLGSETESIADEREPSPEMRLDLEALDHALARLPEKQREAVILFEISGLSLAEIREVQGGSLSGVKSRIVRGREKLAELLGERPPKQARMPAPRETASNETSFERSQVAYLMREKL